jgi:probable aminopeptidase NPEPL1
LQVVYCADPDASEEGAAGAVLAAAVAMARASPRFSLKSSKRDAVPASVWFSYVSPAGSLVSDGPVLARALLTAAAVQDAGSWVDTPCNIFNTAHFVDLAQKYVADLPHVAVTVLAGEALRDAGFGGIYGVGKAAATPPAFVHLAYTPPAASTTIAWAGKGIVYDTGGLSLKTPQFMPGMKADMGGAAAMLAAFKAAVQLGYTENLHALLCLAENAVGPDATRPDDVHIMLSGKSVEVRRVACGVVR